MEAGVPPTRLPIVVRSKILVRHRIGRLVELVAGAPVGADVSDVQQFWDAAVHIRLRYGIDGRTVVSGSRAKTQRRGHPVLVIARIEKQGQANLLQVVQAGTTLR